MFSMNETKNYLVLLIAVGFIAPRYYFANFQQLPIYDHAEPYRQLKNLWTPSELDSLRSLIKNQTFKTQSEEITSPNNLEVILPAVSPGVCPHPYLMPIGEKRDKCMLPQRIDIVRHYMTHGGRYGAKETMDVMANNLQSFQKYLFGSDVSSGSIPALESLFASAQYEESTDAVCGPQHPVRERVQVNLIIMLPGQDLPMHYDLPWFTNGATRHTLPQWLLLAMAGSKIWDDQLLPQVQGVAYLHLNASLNGGDFFLYPEGPGSKENVVILPADSNTGLAVDGIRVIHGVQRFDPGSVSPPIGKNPATLKYEDPSNDLWSARSGDGSLLGQYRTHDLRVSLVWRSICFKDEKERQGWDPKELKLKPEDILQTMEDDLRKRGVLSDGEKRPEPLDFALMMLKEYVRYPVDNFHSAYFPLNYCMLPHSLPEGTLWRQMAEKFVEMAC